MTDDGTKSPLDDFDWDAALSEWDKKPFEPDLAKGQEEPKEEPAKAEPAKGEPPKPAKSPAVPIAAKQPALYRPPQETLDPTASQLLEQARVSPPKPVAKPPAIPRKRGGLGQLFGRGDAPPPAAKPMTAAEEESLDVLFDEPGPRRTVGSDEDDDAVITSAIDVGAEGAPRQSVRPQLATLDVEPNVPDGALFDPFQEPRPEVKNDQPTRFPPPPVDDDGEAATSVADLSSLHAKLEAERARPAAPPPAAGAPPRPATPARPVTPPALPPEPAVPPAPPTPPRAVMESETELVRSDELLSAPALAEDDAELAALLDAPMEAAADLSADSAREPEVVQADVAAPDAAPPPAEASELRGAIVFEDERPAADWLPDEVRPSFEARAAMFEEEAQNMLDKAGRARCLLAASELRAILGQRDESERLAAEALEAGPSLVFAHRQARAFLPFEADAIVPRLDAAAKLPVPPAAKLHDALVAADLLARAGDDDATTKRLEQAARFAPTDARVVVQRAARGLAQDAPPSATLRVPDAPHLAEVQQAISTLLGLRGVERKESGPSAEGTLRRARVALERNDTTSACTHIEELGATAALQAGAHWLAAALGATKSTTRARALALLQGLGESDPRARRALAARALELGDDGALAAAATGDGFDDEERAVLTALANAKPTLSDDVAPALRMALLDREAPLDARLDAIPGDEASKAALRVGRGMAAGKLDPARLDALEPHDAPLVRAARIEESSSAGRLEEVAAALAAWSDSSHAHLAAGLVAERAGLGPRAATAYGAALAADPANEAAARAAAATDPELPLVVTLERVAEACGDPIRAAVLRLELLLRSGDLAERRADLVALAKAAPQLPIANFLAEREARRAGDVEGVLELVRERGSHATDPIERAVDQVREAFLVADTDATLAAGLLEEALRARPDDVAVRELLERISPTPPADRAEWRASRAAAATGNAKNLLLLEAAWDFERQEQHAPALAAVRQMGEPSTMAPLARVALERLEVAAGDAARLADELLSEARSAANVRARSEAYERLAELDRHARNDPASALLWYRTILEETPDHAPSLRYVEHALMEGRRDDELEPILASIAAYLKGTGGEALSHAEVAARFRMNGNQWDQTLSLAELAVAEKVPTLWALRLRNAHARAKDDDEALLATTKVLIERCTRPGELATLLLRATEAATRLGRLEEAKGYVLRATTEDATDSVAWRKLADVHLAAGAHGDAAEALESVARTAAVDEHRTEAYYAAALAWTEAGDEERAVAALEQVASANVTYQEAFPRLSRLYAKRGARTELAALLERRIGTVLDPEERVDLEVERGRVLAEIGDPGAAKEAYDAALAIKPDHVGALSAAGDLAFHEKDWEGAEQVWVRLVRLLPQPEEQLAIYRRLGALYAEQLANYSRAEVAFQEVLKRAPDEIQVREQLVDVYKRQNDPARALEAQQDLIKRAPDSKTKQKRLVELAAIYEYTSHDIRKAEQTLEAARREFPSDVAALRALAEFYVRQKQTPAVNILLDRAAGDARRALAAGRINAALFETMQTVYELRNKEDAGKVVRASLAALKNEPLSRGELLRGGEARALDPRLDDLLAPELLTAAARALLTRTGSALDAAVPFDPRSLGASPYSPTEPAGRLAIGLAQAAGVPNLQLFVSPKLGRACVPAASPSPVLVFGEDLVNDPREVARAFLITRAIKLLQLHGSAFARLPPGDLPVLVGAWLKAFVPNWSPQGIAPAPLAEAGRRLAAGMPRELDPDLGAMALEVIGGVGPQIAALGVAVLSIANRCALLAVGDPGAAFDALAWTAGPKVQGAPATEQERVTFVGRHAEAKDVFAFTLADAYMDARGRLGIR
jgi:tetratricopeptide (TPR) repeat protein